MQEPPQAGSSEKKLLHSNIHELEPIAKNKAIDIVIVEKFFYTQLINWISNSSSSPPGLLSSAMARLLNNDGQLKPNLSYKKHFEAVTKEGWKLLVQVFGDAPKFERHLVLHPCTKIPVVVINEVSLLIIFAGIQSNIKKFCDPSWEVGDVKKQLCDALNVNSSTHKFYSSSHERIDNKMTIRNMIKEYDSPYILKEAMQKSCGNSLSANNLPNYGLSAFRQPNVVFTNPNISTTIVQSDDEYDYYYSSQSDDGEEINDEETMTPIPEKPKLAKYHPGSLEAPKANFEVKFPVRYRVSSDDEDKDSMSFGFPMVSSKSESMSSACEPMPESPPKIEKKPKIFSYNSIPDLGKEDEDIDFLNTPPPPANQIHATPSMDLSMIAKRSVVISPSTPSLPKPVDNFSDCDDDKKKDCIKKSYSMPFKKTFPAPVGLKNLGNTCFFNAAVQCLARVQPLTNIFLVDNFEELLNRENPKGSQGHIALAYRDFLYEMCSLDDCTVQDPSNLRNAISKKYSRFSEFFQQDSQELLMSLLDALHEDLNQAHEVEGNKPEVPPKSQDSYDLYVSRNISPIVSLFNGKIIGTVNCMKCNHTTTSYEPFLYLSLSIPNKLLGTVRLSDCLKAFAEKEILDGPNQCFCPKCKKKVRSQKKTAIYSCSKILIIQLKRFASRGRYTIKIDTLVDYPEKFDINPFTVEKNKTIYKLIGVVFHSGRLTGGHYTSASLDRVSGQWFMFNDQTVKPVSSKEIHNNRAYILFYERA